MLGCVFLSFLPNSSDFFLQHVLPKREQQMHKHSNYLFTRVCQFCRRVINSRPGRNHSGCVDKVSAKRQQLRVNHRPVGRFIGSTQRRFSTKSGKSYWDWSCQRVVVVKETSRERKKIKSMKLWSWWEVAEGRIANLCQVVQQDSGTSEADVFILMKGGQVDGQRGSDG